MKYMAVLILILASLIINCGSKPTPILPAADQFSYAKDLYDRGKFYKAQKAFENLIYTYPGNTVIDTAQYYLGMSIYGQKDYAIAAGEFSRLISSYKQSAFADDAQYQIGMCHYKMSPKYQLDQEETYQAIDEFRKLITGYPTSTFVSEARSRIKELESKIARKYYMNGRLYLKLANYDPALLYFTYVRDNYPATPWAIEAFYYSGEAQLKLGKTEEAVTTFQNFLTGFSDHKLAPKAREMLDKINATSASDGS